MNKDDIFTFNVREDAPGEYCVECALSWNKTANIQVSAPGENMISHARIEAMGWMMEQHADEIITYIQADIIAERIQADMKDNPHLCCKCGDTEYFACSNHSHTAYICTDCAALEAL